jgi:hypothetical protein
MWPGIGVVLEVGGVLVMLRLAGRRGSGRQPSGCAGALRSEVDEADDSRRLVERSCLVTAATSRGTAPQRGGGQRRPPVMPPRLGRKVGE